MTAPRSSPTPGNHICTPVIPDPGPPVIPDPHTHIPDPGPPVIPDPGPPVIPDHPPSSPTTIGELLS